MRNVIVNPEPLNSNLTLTWGLTRRQAELIAFISVFVTVIGGFLLALYFRHRNATSPWNKPFNAKLTDRNIYPTRVGSKTIRGTDLWGRLSRTMRRRSC